MTIFDALENAQMNFETVKKMRSINDPIFEMALAQLSNAIKALDDGNDALDELPTEGER